MSKHVIFIAIKLKLGLQRHSKLDEASAYNSKKSFKWCIIIDIESGPKTGERTPKWASRYKTVSLYSHHIRKD